MIGNKNNAINFAGAGNTKQKEESVQPGTSKQLTTFEEEMAMARRKADEMIRVAELNKAKIMKAPGKMLVNPELGFEHTNHLLCDESFFHYAAHVDKGLRDKIKKGEFIELEKLLQKNKCKGEDNKIELLAKNGSTYCLPVGDGDAQTIGFLKNGKKHSEYMQVYILKSTR